ncbi:hypothetical protein Vafri_21212 [Volvox africanus]|uniref:BTB domain-containing protein n=1 Tax=Volvox africanus TaxID=51714 RepID=A0A8J4BYI6_9CHLO|nr:hypothetical protein Vafri_21212 [Volvox africanus]
MLDQMRSWVPLLLDAHDAVTTGASITTAAAATTTSAASNTTAADSSHQEANVQGGRASAIGDGCCGYAIGCTASVRADTFLVAHALLLEVLRIFSTSRRFWAVMLQPTAPPQIQRQAQPEPGSSVPGRQQRQMREASFVIASAGRGPVAAARPEPAPGAGTGRAILCGRLLKTLSVHFRPLSAAYGIAGALPQRFAPPLLPVAAMLLCHPDLWQAAVVETGGGDQGRPRADGAGACVGVCGTAQLQIARKELLQHAVKSLEESAGSGSDPALWVPPSALLLVMAAALMPHQASRGELPQYTCVLRRDEVLAPVLALAVRAVLQGGAGGGNVAANAATLPFFSSSSAAMLGGSIAAGGYDSGAWQEVEASAAAAAGWLLLRLLAARATEGTIETASLIAGRWASLARGMAPCGRVAQPPDAVTSAPAVAVPNRRTVATAAADASGEGTADARLAAAVTRVMVGHFATLGRSGSGGQGGGGAGRGDLIGCDSAELMHLLHGELSSFGSLGSLMGRQAVPAAGRQLFRFQVLTAAASTNSTANAATHSESAPASCTVHPAAARGPVQASASPPTTASRQQLLLSALSRCCGELLAAPRPPGLMGPSLALHACLGAMLTIANQMPPHERAAAMPSGTTATAAAAAATTRVLPPDIKREEPAARLDGLLVALATGPSLDPFGSETPHSSQMHKPNDQHHGGAAPPATEAMAAAAAAYHHKDVLQLNPSWSRWWWAEAGQAEAFVTGLVSGQQRVAAATAVHLHGGSGTCRGEARGASDNSSSDGEDTESDAESDNNGVTSGQDSGIGVSTVGPESASSGGGGGGRDKGALAPAALRYMAPTRLYCAVRRLIWVEIRCTCTALLSSCFRVLMSQVPVVPGVSTTAASANCRGTSTMGGPEPSTDKSSFRGDNGDGCNRAPVCNHSGSEPVTFAPPPLLAEFSDAEFSFASAPGGDEQTQQPGAATSMRPALPGTAPRGPAAAVAAPAALVASGCPALAAKLREMLLQPPRVVVEAAGTGGSGDEGEGGHASTSYTADQEAKSGRRGVGFAADATAAAVAVAPWPRKIQVQMGPRVPRAAFSAVMEYLTQGFALLPYRSKAATEPGAGAAAEEVELREVAALASALGLTELRAIARGTVPRPGSGPPPVTPRLAPLFPHHLLLLPQPPLPPPPSLRPQHPSSLPSEQQQQQSAESIGESIGESALRGHLPIADKAAADSRGPAVPSRLMNPSSRSDGGVHLGGGPAEATPLSWPRHPPLEEQLEAIMRWEQEQDDLSRLALAIAPTTSTAKPTALPRYIAVDAICLAGGLRTAGRCGGGDGGHDSEAGGIGAGGAEDGDGSSWDCPCPWPADCVLAVPVLRRYDSTLHHPMHVGATTVCARGAVMEGDAAGDAQEGVLSASKHCGKGENDVQCTAPGGLGAHVSCRTILIPAHRVVLASGSEYFAAAFSADRWAGSGGGSGYSDITASEGHVVYLRPVGMPAGCRGGDGGGHLATAAQQPSATPLAALDSVRPVALPVRLLRVPGCDADTAVAVLHYLHHRQELCYRIPPQHFNPSAPGSISTSASYSLSSPSSSGAREAAAGMPLWDGVQLLPLRECEWAPVTPPDPERRATPPSHQQTDGGDRGICLRCQELRLCLRVLLACNALLLPDLEHRVVHHVIQLLTVAKDKKNKVQPSCRHSQSESEQEQRRSSIASVPVENLSTGAHYIPQTSVASCSRHPPTISCSIAPAEAEATAAVAYLPGSTSLAADHLAGSGEGRGSSSRFAVGCLLTAMRDGAVLQLQWLVTTALEELIRQYDSAEARQAAEWDELPEGLQHAALDSWARRARAAKGPTSSKWEIDRHGVGTGLVGSPAAAVAPGMAGAASMVACGPGKLRCPSSSGDAGGRGVGGGANKGDGAGLLGAMGRLALVMGRSPSPGNGGVVYAE